MSSELVFDDDLLIKSYNDVQLEATPLTECVEKVNNCSGEVLYECSNKSEIGEETAEEISFNVGDCVRCIYDDGIDYEAKILYINAEKGTCRIKYIGYENEQTVKLDALVASWGEEARATQYAAAKLEESAATNPSANVSKKTNTKTQTQKGFFNPPPVPPIPPMLFDSDDEEKNQQFAQLLISWFMTGYYTGLHQRNMQESKKFNK